MTSASPPPEQLVPDQDQLRISVGDKEGLANISQGVHAYLKETRRAACLAH
jgi:hypothetical protein